MAHAILDTRHVSGDGWCLSTTSEDESKNLPLYHSNSSNLVQTWKDPEKVTANSVDNEVSKTIKTSSHSPYQITSAPRVYSIPLLLAIGEKHADVSIMQKVKTEAIHENLFQYLGIEKGHRPTGRSRGVSIISNYSNASDQMNLGENGYSSSQKSHFQPLRQPRNPPKSYTCQQDEGFLRFLKQHASPPHHRVTAGGRIVPTGPLSPPPMFDYASLTGLIQNTAQRQNIPRHSGLSAVGNSNYYPHPVAYASRSVQDHSRIFHGQNHHPPAVSKIPPDFTQTPGFPSYALPNPNETYAPVPPLGTVMPIGPLNDGTSLMSINGACYRTHFNGTSIVLEPVHIVPANKRSNISSISNDTFKNDPALFPAPQTSFRPAATRSGNLEPQNNLGSGTGDIFYDRVSSCEEGSLRSQLTEVNKYLAMHHYDLDQAQRASLIAQRRSLTDMIDRVRTSKEPAKLSMPIVGPASDAKGGERKQHIIKHTTSQDDSAPSLHMASLKKLPVTQNVKKILSPNAPAFVPGGDAFPTFNPPGEAVKSENRVVSFGIRADKLMNRSEATQTPAASNHRTLHERTSHEGPEYSPVDPKDPAMRIVHYDNIKYAARFEKELPGTKAFCTTIQEFQEAIRRVREQARLYGCAGGSSKDPAYDAEQDIWWAICDQQPIPLPSKVPFHVAHPRPWNWNDSCFNIRGRWRLAANGEFHPLSCSPAMHKSTIVQNQSGSYTTDECSIQKPSSRLEDSRSLMLNGNRLSFGELVPKSRDVGRLSQSYIDNLHGTTTIKAKSDCEDESLISTGVYPAANTVASVSKTHLGVDKPIALRESNHHQEKTNRAPSPAYSNVMRDRGNQNSDAKAIHLQDRAGRRSPIRGEENFVFYECEADVGWNHEVISPLSKNTTDSGNYLCRSEELETISKLQWEPGEEINMEDDCLSIEKGNLKIAHLRNPTPKVKFPSSKEPASHDLLCSRPRQRQRSPCTEHIIRDAQFIESTNRKEGQPDVDSSNFLRDMLKSPRYSHDFHRKDEIAADPISRRQTAEAKNLTKELQRECDLVQKFDSSEIIDSYRGTVSSTLRPSKKENRIVNRPKVNVSSPSSSISSPLSPQKGLLDRSAVFGNKSGFSLASSTYQAQGFLPRFEGAGTAHTASVYRQHGYERPHQHPRVNLPPSSSFQDTPMADESSMQATNPLSDCDPLSGNKPPLPFSIDGAGDLLDLEEPKSNNETAKEKIIPPFDSRGVTTADFTASRPDPNNPNHRMAVNDFFSNLHEKEVKHIMAMKRKNAKTAP